MPCIYTYIVLEPALVGVGGREDTSAAMVMYGLDSEIPKQRKTTTTTMTMTTIRRPRRDHQGNNPQTTRRPPGNPGTPPGDCQHAAQNAFPKYWRSCPGPARKVAFREHWSISRPGHLCLPPIAYVIQNSFPQSRAAIQSFRVPKWSMSNFFCTVNLRSGMRLRPLNGRQGELVTSAKRGTRAVSSLSKYEGRAPLGNAISSFVLNARGLHRHIAGILYQGLGIKLRFLERGSALGCFSALHKAQSKTGSSRFEKCPSMQHEVSPRSPSRREREASHGCWWPRG